MQTAEHTSGAWCSSGASLAKLVAVVFNDSCPDTADAAYLYGEEPKNEESVLARGGEMLAANTVGQVLFCGGADQKSLNGSVYSPKKWEEYLLKFAGSRGGRVYGIPRESFSHTHIEAKQLILHASKCGINTLFVTAVTPHQIRAFVETVWAIRTGCGGILPQQHIKVWSKPPLPPRSWHAATTIAQTQSGGEKPMIDTIADELERMERYWKKGDLVTCEEVCEYLAWRDG